MSKPTKSTQPVFVHSLFRAGSTYLYYVLKRTKLVHIYHEPFHEVIESLPTALDDLESNTEQLKASLRHDFLKGGYFDEYLHLLPQIKKTFRADMSFDLFFLGKRDKAPALKRYIGGLISGAPRRPVLQCTRTIGRVQWLKEHFVSGHIFLLRNPWDQWFSYKVNPYIAATPQIIYSQPRLPSVLTEVMMACRYTPLSGRTTAEKQHYSYSHPITPLQDYWLFFGLWLYAFVVGHEYCDVIIDMDETSLGKNGHAKVQKSLKRMGLRSTKFYDCRLHRAFFTRDEERFYREIEMQIIELFRQYGAVEKSLPLVEEYLEKQRAITFAADNTTSVSVASLVEDASRLRQHLIVSGSESVRIINQRLAERDGQIANLNQAVAARDEALAAARQAAESQRAEIAGLTNTVGTLQALVAKRETQLEAVQQEAQNQRADIARLGNSVNSLQGQVTDRDGQIANLNQTVANREFTIKALYDSHSWKLTAPLRYLMGFVKGRKAKTIERNKVVNESAGLATGADAFFTICSKNFLAHARVLHDSIRPHYPSARFFVVLCDRVDDFFDPALEPFEFVYLEELNLPNLNEMARRYNITEFNTAVKPFAFSHLMDKYGFGSVVYLDPDLLFVDKLQELDIMLLEGAAAVLTPHILQPAEHDEIHDRKILLFGVYNLGFLALRNTPSVRSFLAWMGRRLERDCVIRLDQGLFVDQKWADLLPAFVPGARVLHHPGYNVAYWNLPQRKITRNGKQWFANGQPLRFVHFSGNKVDDPNVFSRHSQQVTMESIGDLRYLLNFYREQVFSEGHQFYRKLPYAYSWDGEAGVNLHTPKSLDMAASDNNSEALPLCNDTAKPKDKGRNKMLARINVVRKALPMARRLSGGWLPFARRAWRAYQRNGWGHVKARAVELSGFRIPPLPDPENILQAKQDSSVKKRLLYLDWAIPKPDQDAASVTAVLLMKIFDSLGYAVTFIPCGLKYEEGYYESLVAAGIDVVCYPNIYSVKDWINNNAKEFDVCILARGPVVWPYLEILRKFTPNLRLIFNTVDLHYLRELRQAELAGGEKACEAAMVTWEQELDLIKQCDLTILLSNEELYTVRQTYPEARLTVLPVVFEDIPGAVKKFEDRRDILFIGSLPHQPNVDAVIYFAEKIFPLIQSGIPDIRFRVVGAHPPESILNLTKNKSIDVLGFVKDLEPLFENIRLSVAPLRYGAGIKGKIGSSLCYGVPCIATPMAIEGMGLISGQNVLVGETPEEFANAVCQVYLDKDLWRRISEEGNRFALENYSVEVIRDRVTNMLRAVGEGWRPIESAVEIDSWNSFQHHRERMRNNYDDRVLWEQTLLPVDGSENFHTSGYCCVCRQETKFLTSLMYSTGLTPDGRKMPNWREHMQCAHCGLVNRTRAALNALHTLAVPKKESRIYLTEHLTSTYRWLQDRYQNVQGSEYFGSDPEPGTMVNGIRHEDVMNLSFADSSFDRVLSLDVLEHVPDPQRAFHEIYRVLNNKGIFLFSVPFCADSRTDIVRATLSPDGKIQHLLPEEYHGNPVDPEGGALCFRYFGWELLDQLRAIGFRRVRALAYWSEMQGYLGREQYLFIAEKVKGAV